MAAAISKKALLSAACFLLAGAGGASAATCEDLAKLQIADTTIVAATSITPPFKIGSALSRGVTIASPFCRVVGFGTPVAGSKVGFEVWLPPADKWNRKYFATGNGGWSGAFNYDGVAGPLARGYAVMTTDQGHINDPANPVEDVRWALGQPERVIDFAYRAGHVATIAAKAIVAGYYGTPPQHAYFSGCSAGGGQGITESLRYPTDYDGYIYGASGPDHLAREVGGLWDALAASLGDFANAIRLDQLKLVHDEVLKQCAGKDGGLAGDSFLTNPAVCKPDLRRLQCGGDKAPATCLSAVQVSAFQKVYQGPVNPRTGQSYEAGFSPGSEPGWILFTGKKNPVGEERPWSGFFADIVFEDPNYLAGTKYLHFDFEGDYAAMIKKNFSGQTLGSLFSGDAGRSLDPVRAEGGKIIAYHGWEDGDAPAMASVEMFNDMVAKEARLHHLDHKTALRLTEEFYRLFMVPGLGHCRGGSGPGSFGQPPHRPEGDDALHDTLTALENWVERGEAPQKFIGSHVDAQSRAVDMTRPVCPYPQVARWTGSGSTSDAANFTCSDTR